MPRRVPHAQENAQAQESAPCPGECPRPRPGRSAAEMLACRPLSKRPALMPELGKHTLQLAILFYWLMWASGQEELGLNQYSFYYVIVGK